MTKNAHFGGALVPTNADAQLMLMLVLSIACCGNAMMPN